MFQISFGTQPNDLNVVIDQLIEALKTETPGTEEYNAIADQLVKLYKLKDVDNNAKSTVSADTLFAIGGNLLALGLLMNFERLHVITTKALGLATKVIR
jgi:hypothetical protein